MQKISVDEFMFIEAFQRDEAFEHYPQSIIMGDVRAENA